MESKQNHYSQLPIFQEESPAEQSRIRQRAPKLKETGYLLEIS